MSYFDDHEDDIIYGLSPGLRREPRDRWSETCKFCGATGLKWRLDDDGNWRLYEDERIEHNRLKPHACQHAQPDADDFDDIS